MKNRHKIQQRQSQRTRDRNNAAEVQEDEQLLPGKPKPKKHGGSIHAARARHHLGKRGRTGQRIKRFDDGGVASGSSTRSADDPGNEIATANKGRKSTLDWIKDEVMGGTRPAYARGGRQRPKKFDDGGSIADASPVPAPNLAFGSGPPPPPRASDDGMPIPAAPPRANDPGFVNRLNASQKNAQLKQRVKQLEGKGR